MYDEKRRRSEMNTAIRMGREEGRAEGLADGRVEIAKEMLSDGMPVDKISKYTGLTAEEIMSLMA
jgi:predicted transposase/invertase (TIGR01784 family)